MSDPEAAAWIHLARNRHVFAREAADDQEKKRVEKHVHAELLKFRILAAVDDRR